MPGKKQREGLRNIQNTERLNYPDLASRQVSIKSLGFYVLNLLPSLWVQRESYTERLLLFDRAFLTYLVRANYRFSFQ